MQLQIDTYGVVISCQNKMFAIKGANIDDARIPVREVSSIRIGPGVRLTSDVVLLALKHDIPLLFVNRAGMPKGQIWQGKFGSITTVRRKQLHFSEQLQGMQWVQQVILRKIQNQQGFIYTLAYSQNEQLRDKILTIIPPIERVKIKLKQIDWKQITEQELRSLKATWRGWEGTASRCYFQVLALIVPENYRFSKRSGQHAKDRFNCLLNYCYGILYGQVELALIKAGLDPSIGVFHADQYNKPTLVFDMIEAYRIWAETVAIQLCQAHVLGASAFEQHTKGLWLSSKGKPKVIDHFFRYFHAPDLRKGAQFTRASIVDFECQKLVKNITEWIK